MNRIIHPVKKQKSKATENETVCLEWKMFLKVDKHKQNDQNKKNTSFWKASKEKKGFPSTKNIFCLSESNHRITESIDRGTEKPQTILDLFGKNIFVNKITYNSLKFLSHILFGVLCQKTKSKPTKDEVVFLERKINVSETDKHKQNDQNSSDKLG